MTYASAKTPSATQGLRLQTLIRLRWLAIIGQATTILVVYFLFEFPFPFLASMSLIILSVWLNIILTVRWPSSLRLPGNYATLLLAYDVLQLAALLFLTGGLSNPFSFLFLVPVTVSAASLSFQRTILLVIFVLCITSFLSVFHYPLPWQAGQLMTLPNLYIAGIWSAISCGMTFSILYTYRVSAEARNMSDALAATEYVLAQEQRLSELDGLAAAAAHELGTPLATIALVAKELQHDLPNAADYSEDLELLSSQTARCREILATLANRDAQLDDAMTKVRLSVLLGEIIEPRSQLNKTIELRTKPVGDEQPEPIVSRNPGVRYGIANLLDNALDYAKKRILVEMEWGDEEVIVTISDDGPGFSEDIIDKLGEPYVTSRKGYSAAQLAGEPVDGHPGMGLGFFIAKTLLTRSGATVALANLAAPETGAVIRIAWPSEKIQQKDHDWTF